MECESGLCLHTNHSRDRGYVCSGFCIESSDCPINWRCVQTYPSEASHFCVPEAKGAVE
jgi:hypothetical protein